MWDHVNQPVSAAPHPQLLKRATLVRHRHIAWAVFLAVFRPVWLTLQIDVSFERLNAGNDLTPKCFPFIELTTIENS